MVFKSQMEILCVYLFYFCFSVWNVHLQQNYRIFIVLSSTFVVVMPNIVKSLEFNIFIIRAQKQGD